MAERRLLFEVFMNHRHCLTRDAGQDDIVYHQKAQTNAHRSRVLPLVFLTRQRTRFNHPAGATDRLLLAPNAVLVRSVDSARTRTAFGASSRRTVAPAG